MPGGDLTKNFSLWEFECPDCGLRPETDDPKFRELLHSLQRLREAVGWLDVSSGIRCPTHNRAVGGESASYHLYNGFAAADVVPRDSSIQRVFRVALADLRLNGVFIYPLKGHVHLDNGDRVCIGETRGDVRMTIWLGPPVQVTGG